MNTFVSKTNAFLEKRWTGYFLILIVVVVYVTATRFASLYPGNKPNHPQGWWEWADQGLYLKSAASLARLSFSPADHHYPLGYSMLGAPFLRWMPADPFLIPNLLLVVGSVLCVWRLSRRQFSSFESLVFIVVFVVCHAPLLARTNIVPWSTIPTQCALLFGLCLLFEPPDPKWAIWMSVAAVFTYLVRPADCLPFAPMLMYAVGRIPSWKQRIGYGVAGMVVLAAGVVLVGAENYLIYGSFRSPYEAGSIGQIGFFSYPIAEKLFVLLVDPRVFFLEKTPGLLFRYPWLFFVIPGIIFWIRKEGAAGVVGVVAVAISYGLYLNYNDFLPSDIYRYNLIHYLVWTFPVLALLVAGAAVHGWRLLSVQLAFVGSIVFLVLCVGLRLDETTLPPPARCADGWTIPETRSLIVRYKGIQTDTPGSLILDGRVQSEYLHFLKPEARGDLGFWLGPKARGTCLNFQSAADRVPELSVFSWGWKLRTDRFGSFCQ